jgi:hypothetical protein
MRSLLIATSFFSLFILSASRAQEPLLQGPVERRANDDLGERAVPARETATESEIDYEALNGTVVEGPLVIKRIVDSNQSPWIKSRVVVKVAPRPSLQHQAAWIFRGEDVFTIKNRLVKYPVWEARWVATQSTPAVKEEQVQVAAPTVFYLQYPTVTFPTPTLFPTTVVNPLLSSPWFSNTTVIERRPLLFPNRTRTTVILPGVISY